MESVKYILGLPEFIPEIGSVYPIQMYHYDEFMDVANLISLDYDHFIDAKKYQDKIDSGEIKLFDFIYQIVILEEQLFPKLVRLFELCTRSEVELDDNLILFHIKNGGVIHRLNFDSFRQVVMKQNLLFTPKVYRNKKLQEIANKVIKTRAKNSLKTSIEDMITTIAAYTGKSYEKLAEYTIYQLKAEFNRILKIEDYRRHTLFQTVDTSGKINPEHFAEEMDMFKNPYDDLFKEKSSFKNINQIFGKNG